MTETLDFKSIALGLMTQVNNIIIDLLPSGELKGKHWTCGDINGSKGNSFKFNIETGVWRDFANSESGGKDIISLYAKQKNLNMRDAAIELRQKYLGGASLIKYNYPVKKDKNTFEIIKPPVNTALPHIPGGSKHWTYVDENGEVLYYVVRWDKDGKKNFYPLSFCSNNSWVKKSYTQPVLKDLNEIARHTSKPVLIVEGEKAQEAAKSIINAYIVTTWHGGANAWRKTDWSPLRGRKILLWPDADDAGKEAMAHIAQHLISSIGIQEIKMINTDKSNGWDAADAFEVEKWSYKDFAEWASKITKIQTIPEKNNIIERIKTDQIEISGEMSDVGQNLIPTDDFPVSPNMQMRFIELGLQFSDSKQTRVVMNAANVAKILRADFVGIAWLDTFYGKIFTTWESKNGKKRQWSDADTNSLYIKMQHYYELAKISKHHVMDAIEFVASINRKSEPFEWLSSLVWDGVSRIDDFFNVAMGAEKTEYTRCVSKNFWIAMAARITDSGCKMDEMIVLEGPQGTYKTTSLEVIGGEWYGEVNSDISSKDFDQGLKGKVIVEFGELANLKKADIEIIKRKLSTRIDEYRPSYGRYVEQHPRTCIFVGTTNEREYLKDLTGNRRFWPMLIKRANIEYIKRNREQLFAEAYKRYVDGEVWHEVPWDEAEKIRSSRMEYDEWENILSDIVYSTPMKSNYFTMDELWERMGSDRSRLSKSDQMRMGRCLRSIGCEQETIRVESKAKRVWYLKTERQVNEK